MMYDKDIKIDRNIIRKWIEIAWEKINEEIIINSFNKCYPELF